jgi:hypothetical protein
MNCFNCSKPVITNAFFCPSCMTQVRCKSCQTPLLKDAIGCIECGEFLVVKKLAENGALNQIDFEQKGDTKKFRATFTNEVGHTLVETFGTAVVGGNLLSKKRLNPFTSASNSQADVRKSLQVGITYEDADYENVDLSGELAKIFKQDGESLVLINPRLKQTSKLDNAIRLSILSLFAYEQIGNNEIDRKVLTAMLKSSKLNIAAFSTWITRCDEILKNGNKVQLSVPGRTVAAEILKELADNSIVKGQVKVSKVSSSTSRKKKVSADQETKKESNEGKTNTKKGQARGNKVSILNELISEGFFNQKKKIYDIVEYCKDNKATTFRTNELSTPLGRLIKNKVLKREKNSEGQNEYFK